jgi:hypothetical protein
VDEQNTPIATRHVVQLIENRLVRRDFAFELSLRQPFIRRKIMSRLLPEGYNSDVSRVHTAS